MRISWNLKVMFETSRAVGYLTNLLLQSFSQEKRSSRMLEMLHAKLTKKWIEVVQGVNHGGCCDMPSRFCFRTKDLIPQVSGSCAGQ